MTKNREISQEKFEKLLDWLDLDRESAGRKYELIRSRLIKVFTLRGCQTPDELADVTIDVVTEKIESITENYNGDQALYFYGVGKKVFAQYLKKTQLEPPQNSSYSVDSNGINENDLQKLELLDKCLQKLKKKDQELILAYYQDNKREKIDRRKLLAEQLGLSAEKLRVRIYRLKNALEKCVRNRA